MFNIFLLTNTHNLYPLIVLLNSIEVTDALMLLPCWRLKIKGSDSHITISTKTVRAGLPALLGYGTSIPRVGRYLRAEVQMRNWGALIPILPATVWDRSTNPFSGSTPQCRSLSLGGGGGSSNPLHLVIWVILWPPSLGINLILLLGGKQGTLAFLSTCGEIRFCVRCV